MTQMLFPFVTHTLLPQVVWERLDGEAVYGNTQMCGPDFRPYRASEPPPRVDMGALSSLPPEALAGEVAQESFNFVHLCHLRPPYVDMSALSSLPPEAPAGEVAQF